jgi:putative ABC transport system permease protein
MLVIESIKMALNSLFKNKLRSILTLVGIAIGLFSIIVVMTAIGAIQSTVENTFNQLGTNNFVVQKFPAFMGPAQWRLYRNRPDLTIEQGERLKQLTSLPAAVGISLDQDGKVIKYKGEATNPDVDIDGINLDELKAENLNIAEGRGFSPQDISYGRSVCIIGADVAEKLFKMVYPIGQTIKADDKMNLTVIGVYAKRGSVLGTGQDEFISIPLTVYKKYYGDKESANYTIMAQSKSLISATMDEVIGALRKIRKIPPGKDNDFEIITNDQLVEQFNSITKYFRIGAGVVAFIALAAAGVGIMNIMLVSVTERTKEIGIRKAIGARKVTIRTQFLVEAIILCQIGGIIGIILGVIGGDIIAGALSVTAIIPIDWIIIGISVTTFVGVAFGVYPAIKASNLDPIEALRYE